MEDILKHPIIILIALASVGISSLINIKLSTDPTARPDSYTGTEAKDRATTVDRRFAESDAADTAERNWRDAHEEWGRVVFANQTGINERHEAQIQELYRRLP